jgi:galactokinase
MPLADKLISSFESEFKRKPSVFIAPGRINLIGEHTDYNDGFVMPAAIDKHFTIAVAANGTDVFRAIAIDPNENITFSIPDLKPGYGWQNYLMGVVDGLARRGKIPGGVDCSFSSTIPAGAGLSSSAALCSGFGFALNELFELGLDRLELAKIAQEAEHHFAGVRVGIMDMYASLFSEDGSVMLLDCRNYTHEYLPLNLGDHEVLLIDTKVKHTLASSEYNDRRAACEAGVGKLQQHFDHVQSLRDVNFSMLASLRDELDETVVRRCSFIVGEIERTQRAGQLLKLNDLRNFGRLMYETHWGLSRDYEVSCPESDWLVNFATTKKVTGARQMGGGFGGCTINLIHREERARFREQVAEKYFSVFQKEPEFYSVKLADGVHGVVDDQLL